MSVIVNRIRGHISTLWGHLSAYNNARRPTFIVHALMVINIIDIIDAIYNYYNQNHKSPTKAYMEDVQALLEDYYEEELL